MNFITRLQEEFKSTLKQEIVIKEIREMKMGKDNLNETFVYFYNKTKEVYFEMILKEQEVNSKYTISLCFILNGEYESIVFNFITTGKTIKELVYEIESAYKKVCDSDKYRLI